MTNQRTLAESRQEGAARATNLHVRVGGRGKRRAACRLEDSSVEPRLVTYNRHPLYYLNDFKRGDVKGQGCFKLRYVLAPKGGPILKPIVC